MEKYKTKDGGFKSLGEFCVKVRKACDGEGTPDSRLISAKTAGRMETSVDAQGGFLVPEQWADGIFEAAALEGAIVRPRARVFPVTRDSLKIRTLVDTDRSSNIYGGITFTWTAERGDKSSNISDPEVGELELTPHKLVGTCYASNELEDDYGAFSEFIAQSFGKALAFIEDDAYIQGTGGGMPIGIVNSGAEITVSRAANNLIDWTDFAHMAKRLLPASWKNAVWLINPDALDEIFEASASAANQATFLDLSNRTCFGAPIIPTEHCSAIDAKGDLILADWRHYVIADRSLEIAGSRHVPGSSGFLTDETFWRIVLRVDGQPTLSAPITPKRGANTLSPFVMLTQNS